VLTFLFKDQTSFFEFTPLYGLYRNNQVQILGSKGKYYVERSVQPAGIGKMAMNMALNEISDGWSGMSGAFGGTKKKCMELVTKTAETINSMGI
jgi:hypothetical protein